MTQFNFGTIVASSKSGAGLASDLNAWRDALHSQHMGSATPTYKIAGLSWLNNVNIPWEDYIWDGNANILRGFIDPTTNRYSTAGNFAKSYASGGAVAHLSDWGTLFNMTGLAAQTVAIDPISTLLPGWWIRVVARNIAVTIDPYGAETLDGAINKLLPAGSSTTVFFDGTSLFTDQGGGGLTDFPIGGVVMVPGINPPGGFLRLNGGLISRVTYAGLWGFAQLSSNISTTDAAWTEGKFSPGDGSTTFRLPDLRGNFMRAWDNSRNLDPSRVIGSSQADGIETHAHTVDVTPGGAHAHSFTNGYTDSAGSHFHNVDQRNSNVGAGVIPVATSYDVNQISMPTNYAGAHTHVPHGTISTSATHDHAVTVGNNPGAANETRPKNIALLACIKY
jgi:microcystin-dependent protein